MSVASIIANRVATHLREGEVVNLGIGIPTRVADHVPPDSGVVLQIENGMLGAGPTPTGDDVDPDLINAGKLPVSELAGASYFSSSESFAMIRGGHVDVAVLGVLEIDARGRIANWATPGQGVLGVGGAMDLIAGAGRVVAATTHLTRAGEPKIVSECSCPLSGDRPADLIVTEHATFATDADGLLLTEIADSASLEWVREHTAATFRVAPHL